jgi:hypothetical protein
MFSWLEQSPHVHVHTNNPQASGRFQSRAEVFDKFYNGINYGPTKQASDSYCWIIGILFGAWLVIYLSSCSDEINSPKQVQDIVNASLIGSSMDMVCS